MDGPGRSCGVTMHATGLPVRGLRAADREPGRPPAGSLRSGQDLVHDHAQIRRRDPFLPSVQS